MNLDKLWLLNDGNGNLQTYKGWTYTYDAQNRLTVADNHAGTRVHYYYDGLNRRIASSDINGNVTILVWDGWNLVEERTSANGLIALYVDGAGTDEKVLRWGPNTPRIWYHQDGRGNVSHLSHDSGILLERYTYDLAGNARVYDPSGNIRTGGTAYANRFLFQGRDYASDRGLYDYRFRNYLPILGRFLQTDPIAFRGDPYNLYRYCDNDSVNRHDRSGLQVEELHDPLEEPTMEVILGKKTDDESRLEAAQNLGLLIRQIVNSILAPMAGPYYVPPLGSNAPVPIGQPVPTGPPPPPVWPSNTPPPPPKILVRPQDPNIPSIWSAPSPGEIVIPVDLGTPPSAFTPNAYSSITGFWVVFDVLGTRYFDWYPPVDSGGVGGDPAGGQNTGTAGTGGTAWPAGKNGFSASYWVF